MRSILTILFVFFALASIGCQPQDTSALCEPNLSTVETMPGFVSKAVDATGLLTSWTKLRRLELDAVVKFYNPDGSFYITEQKHHIQPWCNSIQILANEPQNQIIWQLTGKKFISYDNSKRRKLDTESLAGKAFTQAVLAITTAPACLLCDSCQFAKRSDPVKLEGLSYDAIEAMSPSRTSCCDRFIYYQNRQTNLIDIITLLDTKGQPSLAARGFDYKKISKKSIKIPTRIDIFRTDPEGSLQEKLASIDYYLKTR